MPRRFAWASLPDEKLLRLRLKDLNVSIKGTWLEGCLNELYDELAQRKLTLRPHAWIADEWFSPMNTPGIAIPFYLAHPRLMRLERKKMLEVEGGTVQSCMRILRHEAAHTVQFAYQLHRRRRWQQLFGRSSARYPNYYRPNPGSKKFVQHLRLWYAQAHPDEDFAETFAVWLTPRLDWRKRYEGWPALKKLEYVDELMADIAMKEPVMTRRLVVEPLSRNARTLAEHYEKRAARYVVKWPATYDRDLRRIFSDNPKHRRSPLAAQFIRRNRGKIRRRVAKLTGEHQLTLDAVVDEMITRCSKLKLRAAGSGRQLKMDFTVLLTAKTVQSLHTRRQWFAL